MRVLREHPWAVSVFSPRTCGSEHYLVALELLLDNLRGAGFSAREAAEISWHAIRAAISLVSGQPGITGPHDPEELDELQRRTRLVFEALPRKRYPRIVEAAGPLSACDDVESYYELGMEMLIRGVAAMAR